MKIKLMSGMIKYLVILSLVIQNFSYNVTAGETFLMQDSTIIPLEISQPIPGNDNHIIYLPHNEYIQKLKSYPEMDKNSIFNPLIYGIVGRSFTAEHIYIDNDAFWLNDRDKELVIKHELGHLEGKYDTWYGIMSPEPVSRYLTSSIEV